VRSYSRIFSYTEVINTINSSLVISW